MIVDQSEVFGKKANGERLVSFVRRVAAPAAALSRVQARLHGEIHVEVVADIGRLTGVELLHGLGRPNRRESRRPER